jgi:hypothetical protein
VIHPGNDDVGIQHELGLGVNGQQWSHDDADGTYVEDEKDLTEIRPPGGDRFLVVLRVDKPRDCVPFSFLDNLPLNLYQLAMIKSIISEVF